MNMINSRGLFKKKGLRMTFIIICGLFIAVNAFSQKHWNRDYMNVCYDEINACFIISFEFYDCGSESTKDSGYLEWCDFEYSLDSLNYTHFMRAETYYQMCDSWSWLHMTNKLSGAALNFLGCYDPVSNTKWADNTTVRLAVNNNSKNQAWLTIKWYVYHTPYQDVKYIRINGKWHVIGSDPSENINNEVYDATTHYYPPLQSDNSISYPPSSKTENTITISKLFTESDAIVIKGAHLGEKIKVYNTSGAHIKSIVTTNELMKIKLPANQIYTVQIGQSHYKIVF